MDGRISSMANAHRYSAICRSVLRPPWIDQFVKEVDRASACAASPAVFCVRCPRIAR